MFSAFSFSATLRIVYPSTNSLAITSITSRDWRVGGRGSIIGWADGCTPPGSVAGGVDCIVVSLGALFCKLSIV